MRVLRMTFAAAIVAAATMAGGPVQAAPVYWTDWTATTQSGVAGTLDVDGDAIGVTFTGPVWFAQTDGGTNFWSPGTPYISAAVDNAPPPSDIIALSAGGTKTITFSKAVVNPLIALVSWNGNVVDFGVPIEILSYGAGYWGNGTPVLNPAGTGFTGSGEVHGVIRLPGTYTQITFTDTGETWHGLTVGVQGVRTPNVPEPTSLVLLGLGFAGVARLRRRP